MNTHKAITTFIEDGIKGGFMGGKITIRWCDLQNPLSIFDNIDVCIGGKCWIMSVEELLMRPDLWRAVGKQRGWHRCILRHCIHTEGCGEEWMTNYFNLPKALVNKQDINSYLESIE